MCCIRFHTVFQTPISASIVRSTNTDALQTAHENTSLYEQPRAVHRAGEPERMSSRTPGGAAGRQSPAAAGCVPAASLQSSGADRAALSPLSPARRPWSSPRRTPLPRSALSVTHRRERARGSSSAPALRRPERRRGRGAPWQGAAGPRRAGRRQLQRSRGRDGCGRPGRAQSAGSGGPTACVL